MRLPTGNGFLFLKAVSEERSEGGKFFLEVFHAVTFSQQSSLFANAFWQKVANIIAEIDQLKAGQLQKVDQYRRDLKMRLNFRRKSKQMTAQVRVQGYAMAVLYGALGCFLLSSIRIATQWQWILLSIALFLVGVACNFLILKRVAWKI